mmetsp:Transcript_14169/g.45208  ORF Transcript_14169/g.45208 Transcript_14169/m.45208 type:complete len:215 (-) Transcript_14169:53-697(-)
MSSKSRAPRVCSLEATFTTRAPPASAPRSSELPLRRAGRSKSVSRNGPRKLVPKCISKPSAVWQRARSPIANSPALFTRQWSGAPLSRYWRAKPRTEAREARSSCMTSRLGAGLPSRSASDSSRALNSPPARVLRQASTTCAPRRANSAAVSLPMPLVHPVTMTTLPSTDPPTTPRSGRWRILHFCRSTSNTTATRLQSHDHIPARGAMAVKGG